MSAVTDIIGVVAVPLARLVADVVSGTIKNPSDIAKAILGIALDAAPDEDLHAFLDEQAKARQDALFDLAKKEKLGG